MEAIATVVIKTVEEKVSARGEKYFNCSLVEDTGIKNNQGGNYQRVWDNCFLPSTSQMENPTMLEGVKVKVHMNFYPVGRTVGDKTYTDIKSNIIKFDTLN